MIEVKRANAIQLLLTLVPLVLVLHPDGAKSSEPIALTVGDVRIHGNKKIKSYILRREIPFKRGDIFDEERINKAREQIREVPGVDYSEIRVGYSPRDSALVLTVVVTEKPTFNGRPLFIRGYQNKISLGLELWDRSFRGRSERLAGSILLRGNTILSASWENPWIGTGWRLGVGVRFFYMEYKYVYDDLDPTLADASIERFGGEISFFRRLGKATRIALSGGIETVEGSTPGVTLKSARDTYPTVSLSVIYDSRESPIYPWNGIYFEVLAHEIGPGSDTYSIHEETVDLRAYKSVLGKGIIAGHGRLRYRDGDKIPAYRRDHIGGSQTLRGYDYGSFHGPRSIVAGVEGRLPLNFSMDLPIEYVLLGIAWHAFADAAVAWDDNSNLSTRDFHGTFGVGIDVLSTNSKGLRLEYGWRLDAPGRFEFDFGMKF